MAKFEFSESARYEHLDGDERKRSQHLTCDTCRTLNENKPMAKFEFSESARYEHLDGNECSQN